MVKEWFNKIVDNDIAIDLGTANTLIYLKGEGVVLNEPSVVAMRKESGPNGPYSKTTILAVGKEAKTMLGRSPQNIEAIRPMKDGVIADFNITEEMIKFFINKVHRVNWFTPNPRIVICVPYGATQVERRAIRESAERAGAKQVYLIEEPVAAAIGCGLPINEPIGSMVIDIGGGTTEVGVLSLVYASSVRVGGDKIDQAITDYMRRNYGTVIAEPTAEKIKNQIGSAFPMTELMEMEVTGRNLAEGLPRKITISSNEILEALSDPLHAIIGTVKTALEQTPPELAADISENGMVLTGGGALLNNLDRLLMEETGVPVIIGEEPLTCVVRGCGKTLDNLDLFQNAFTNE